MALQLMSPVLPGVKILVPDSTGPQYSKWRRGVKSALITKNVWGHCDGSQPMPMPESGPNFFSPVVSSNPQPQLLEERKAWMKQDRDVKLDIFLSIADDLKLEVFEVGPPLPPPSMTAKEMLEALDVRFEGKLDFEEYHHAFCHFLNLHIDQFPSVEEFNAEFSATLEDLLDHGMPLDNVQACSAYFSKLRCTQNPWVAKKLKEWNTLSTPPQLKDLMKENPPWMIIKPLKPTAQTSVPESYSEDIMEKIKEVDEEDSSDSDKSGRTTPSTASSHSRSSSTHSQEITVKASVEDLTETVVLPKPTKQVSKKPSAIPKRLSPKMSLPNMTSTPPPLNRPLPPLPSETPKIRSTSPTPIPVKWETTTSNPTNPEKKAPLPRSQTPQLMLPEDVHPALRGTVPPPSSNQTSAPKPTSTPEKVQTLRPQTPPTTLQRPSSSHSPPTLAPLFQSTQLSIRPASSRGPSTYKSILDPKASMDTISTWPPPRSRSPLMRIDSTNSSTISLPLQGANEPEFRDTVMSGSGKHIQHTRAATLDCIPNKSDDRISTVGELRSVGPFSSSPPRSLMSRLSAELNDEERKNRKRSWSFKGKLPRRRLEVQEMI